MTPSLQISTNDLISIGMRFSGETSRPSAATADIESTILEIAEVFPEDPRLASVCMAWIKVHGNYVIVEKLAKLAAIGEREGRVLTWLSLIAAWADECGYHKWRKLIKKVSGPRYFYPESITEGAIKLKGEVPWLKRIGFRLPMQSLRVRERDVLEPVELIAINRQYRNRYLFGASWRADIVTAIQNGVTTPMEISRLVGCSYEPAYRISRDYLLAHSVVDGQGEIAESPNLPSL